MCLIAVALNAHPRYRVVVAANRDEFHARPSQAATWWEDAPDIYGGRDLQQGGTWLACSRDGRWGAVTNVRRMVPPDPQAPSRGNLVAGYLHAAGTAASHVEHLQSTAAHFAGFNLLLGDADSCSYLSNHPHTQHTELQPGVHAVSNASLDTPWPKLLRLREALSGWCAVGNTQTEALYTALADETPVPDAALPDTGVGLALERFLATPFIRGPSYGTRASTLLLIGDQGIHFLERRYGPGGIVLGETSRQLA